MPSNGRDPAMDPVSGPETSSRRRGRSAARVLMALVLIGAGLAAALLLHARWQLRVAGVRFVDHREKVSGGGAALNVTGYIVVRVEGDTDIFRAAREANTYPEVQATLCDSGRPVGAWRDPLPLERDTPAHRFVYAVLVPAGSGEGDLAQTTGDVCLRFLAPGTNPLTWLNSRTVVMSMTPDLREQLQAYRHHEGVVDLTLDTACAPRLCQPE